MKRTAIILLVFAVIAATAAFAGEGGVRRRLKPVPNAYNVVLLPIPDNVEPDLDAVIDDLAAKHHGKGSLRWRAGVRSFLFEGSDSEAQKVSRDPRVWFVEEDALVELAASTASWALDRIDERVSPRTDGDYNNCPTGNGVYVYVVDTGIWAEHSEFSNLSPWTGGARVKPGYDYVNSPNTDTYPCSPHLRPDDYAAAHGTAVASAIGGKTMGTAKDAILRPVRVANCDGALAVEGTPDYSAGETRMSRVTAGLDWIIAPCPPADPDNIKKCDTEYVANSPRVVNMSFTLEMPHPNFGTDDISSLEVKIEELLNNNVSVVVAAGNYNSAVGTKYSPARVPAVITVGATENQADDRRWVNPDQSDAKNRGSNFGSQIDLFAPGANLRLAHWATPPSNQLDPNGVRTIVTTGTSFSAAYVSGVVARILSSGGSSLTPQQIRDRLIAEATNSTHGLNIGNRGTGSPNLLVYSAGCGRPRI